MKHGTIGLGLSCLVAAVMFAACGGGDGGLGAAEGTSDGLYATADASGPGNGGYPGGSGGSDGGVWGVSDSYGPAADAAWGGHDATLASPDLSAPAADADSGSGDASADTETEPEEEWAFFQLSPDDSTSMATAQILRGDPWSFWGFALKPHEVLNYYDPPAELRAVEQVAQHFTTADNLVVALDAVERPGVARARALELLVHLYAPAPPVEERRPWLLHLCVDVSGSMEGEKIAFARQSLLRLLDATRPGDRMSLVVFSSDAEQVFATLDVAENRERIEREFEALKALNSTNMLAGLEAAYAEAQRVFDPDATNRVIVFSDGNANVGDTDIEAFARLTRINNREGIYLSGVGVGSDYAIGRMNALTDAGKGAHVFLPNDEEVGVIFGTMVRKLVEVAADEVSVELLLPASFALERFSGEEVSTDPNARVPNVVLAAGDDMTMLSIFETDVPDDLDRDLILTVRYRPLRTAEEVVFERRLPIRSVVREVPGPLLGRTRLIDGYARFATDQDEPPVDPQLLLAAVEAFTPGDDGLVDVATQLRRQMGWDDWDEPEEMPFD